MEKPPVNHSVLPYLEMVVTTVCNRECRSCSNFIPYIKARAKHVSASEAKTQIEDLKKTIGVIERFQVHGGEPLLNPDLPEIMRIIINEDFIKRIRIATNGTILPSVELLSVLSGSRVKLAISNYHFNKTNIPLIEQRCKGFGVEYIIYEKQLWYEFGKNVGITFDTCPINKYPVLFDSKVYLCARICHAYSDQGQKYCIDIRDTVDLKSALHNDYLKKGCNMCNITHKLIDPGF